MDQYVRWRGGVYHDDFYTDQTIRQWYKNWIAHVLNHTNIYTGVQYKNDPTIMTWELANEPRCTSAGVYPRSGGCTTDTLVRWAQEMSTYVKSIDRNHLVSVGDEGFYCSSGSADWTENCNEGVDTVAFARLRNIDVMSFHLYPDSWGKDASWGKDWIRRHIRDANAVGKAVMLGEFGLKDKNRRNAVYKDWTDTVLRMRGDGALFWILSDKQDDGTLYPDYDQFTVYCPSPVCTALSNFSKELQVGLPLPFKPIADDDRVETAFNTQATITPLQNDFAYWPLTLLPGSIDLDPTAAGQQTMVTQPSGVFLLQSDSTVSFTPAPGFVGEAVSPYVVRDNARRPTNTANLRITVRPNPTAAITLFSFESGTEGWHSINNLAATVSQSNQYATQGAASLRIDVGGSGDWFGTNLSTPLDLSAKTRLLIDLTLVGAGQGHNVALQVGSGWAWCEGPAWVNADANSSTTLEVDLTAMGCRADQNDVKAVWLFLGDNRTYYIDNVRAE
jgi:mannan endo-1,4-beta-mannosidase